jgi:growth hormone-inducible transmembrane protein
MAFILRRPFAIANALKQAPRASRHTVFQPFQQQVSRSFSQQSSRPLTKFAKNENAFLNAFRQSSKQRRYQSTTPANPIAQGNLTQRLIYGGMDIRNLQIEST